MHGDCSLLVLILCDLVLTLNCCATPKGGPYICIAIQVMCGSCMCCDVSYNICTSIERLLINVSEHDIHVYLYICNSALGGLVM